jgi:hypothetical protein
MKMNSFSEKMQAYSTSEKEADARANFYQIFQKAPIPDAELLSNVALFTKRQDLSRMLFFNDLYQKILDVHGVIMEFGVRWGRDLALLQSLRGIYEPFNHNRKIIGFDTFGGFPTIHKKDGEENLVHVGSYAVSENYDEYLDEVLDYHEQESPISHMKKYELIKGDATIEIVKYFEDNPETIISFIYFDLDIYEPTKKCLEVIRNHITKGTVIGFDELNLHHWPGETIALKEVFGLDKYRIKRNQYSAAQSFLVVE